MRSAVGWLLWMVTWMAIMVIMSRLVGFGSIDFVAAALAFDFFRRLFYRGQLVAWGMTFFGILLCGIAKVHEYLFNLLRDETIGLGGLTALPIAVTMLLGALMVSYAFGQGLVALGSALGFAERSSTRSDGGCGKAPF